MANSINEFSEKNRGKILAFNALVTVTLFFFLLSKLNDDGNKNKRKQRA